MTLDQILGWIVIIGLFILYSHVTSGGNRD